MCDGPHNTRPPFSLSLSRMEDKTTPHPVPSSSRSRAIVFALLGWTLVLAVVLFVNLFHPAAGSDHPATAASDRDPAPSSCGQDFDPMQWRGPTVGKIEDSMENPCCNGNVGGVPSTHRIPFFGSADVDTMSKSWSHLNHRVEEYRHDLVKAVEVSTLVSF